MAYVTHYHQGLELARRFQAARALVEFESCLAIRPDQREALFHKARMLLHLERTAEGVALLDRLATSEPAMLAACQLLIEFYDAPGPLNDPNKARALKTSVAKACGQLGAFDRVVRRWQGLGCPPPSPSVVLIHKPKMLGIQTMDSRLSRYGISTPDASIVGFPYGEKTATSTGTSNTSARTGNSSMSTRAWPVYAPNTADGCSNPTCVCTSLATATR
jgi:hypothetical protein